MTDENEYSKHNDKITNPDHTTSHLGELEGIAVRETTEDGEKFPMLFLHGTKQSCAVDVNEKQFTDGLARAGVELESILNGRKNDY